MNNQSAAAEKKQIPFFNYPALFLKHQKEYLAIIDGVCSRGAYILQKDLIEFEKTLADFLKVKHAFGVANGTDALIIALRASGIGAGDEVVLPSHTYIASAAAVHFVGARPVLAECGPDHMLDPESAEKLITKKTRALMPVHINGRTCRMDALEQIAEKHQLVIVEDAAQGLGSRFKNKYAGTFGAAAGFSFYPAKLLGCFGDGGAVVTDDDALAKKISLFRDHGRNEEGRVVEWGYNSRLDNLQGAILQFKMKDFTGEIERRRQIASLYIQRLKPLKELLLPPGPQDSGEHYDVYQNFEIEADRRDALRQFLDQNGVRTIIQWGGTPVHQFKELGFNSRLPETERIFKRCMLLPMNTSLKDEDVFYVCDRIREFYSRRG